MYNALTAIRAFVDLIGDALTAIPYRRLLSYKSTFPEGFLFTFLKTKKNGRGKTFNASHESRISRD